MIDLLQRIERMERAAKHTFLDCGGVPVTLHVWLSEAREVAVDLDDAGVDGMPLVIPFHDAGMQLAWRSYCIYGSCEVECLALLSMGIICEAGKGEQSIVSIIAIDVSDDPSVLYMSYDIVRTGENADLANRQIIQEKGIDLRDSPLVYAFLQGVKLYKQLR